MMYKKNEAKSATPNILKVCTGANRIIKHVPP